MPIASMAEDMVFAVNMPPHEPTPGQAWRSTSSSSASSICPALNWPTASKALTMVRFLPSKWPGLIVPPYTKMDGNIQPRDGDHRARHIFVAAADGQQAVHARRAADRLDGVGDHFARNQRILHALGAHGDAVAHGDGAEHLRHGLRHSRRASPARWARSFKSGVAGRNGAVAVGDADDGLIEIAVAKSYRAQHGAIGGALDSLRDQSCFYRCCSSDLFSVSVTPKAGIAVAACPDSRTAEN